MWHFGRAALLFLLLYTLHPYAQETGDEEDGENAGEDTTSDAESTNGNETTENGNGEGENGEGNGEGDGDGEGEGDNGNQTDGDENTDGDDTEEETDKEYTIDASSFLHCSDDYKLDGCPRSKTWSIQNTELLEFGWRVFEVKFFSDEFCTENIKPVKYHGSDPMTCQNSYEVRFAFDGKEQTLWVSQCGLDSNCGFAKNTDSAKPDLGSCLPEAAFLAVSFAHPETVKCVRLLQGGAPFAASRVTIRAHLGNLCFTCAEGSIDITSTKFSDYDTGVGIDDDLVDTSAPQNMTLTVDGELVEFLEDTDPDVGYMTLMGTPGLLGQFYNNLWDYSNLESMDWNTDYTSEALHSTIHFPLSEEPLFMGVNNNTFVARWTGLLRIVYAGEYQFNIVVAGRARLFIKERGVIEVDENGAEVAQLPLIDTIEKSSLGYVGAVHSDDAPMTMKRALYDIVIEYEPLLKEDVAGIVFTWMPVYGSWSIVPVESLSQKLFQDIPEALLGYQTKLDFLCADTMGLEFTHYQVARVACDFDVKCGGIVGTGCFFDKITRKAPLPQKGIDLCVKGRPTTKAKGKNEEGWCILEKRVESEQTEPPEDNERVYERSRAAEMCSLILLAVSLTAI